MVLLLESTVCEAWFFLFFFSKGYANHLQSFFVALILSLDLCPAVFTAVCATLANTGQPFVERIPDVAWLVLSDMTDIISEVIGWRRNRFQARM